MSRPLDVDLSGKWRIVHHVDASERTDFVGLEIEFQMSLTQSHDGQIAGGGEKFLVNREAAPLAEVSQVEFTGWVQDLHVQIALVEIAMRGSSTINGTIVWDIASPDHLIGTFHVDLAATSGRSEARREWRHNRAD